VNQSNISTAASPPAPSVAADPSRWTARRIAAVSIGVLLGLVRWACWAAAERPCFMDGVEEVRQRDDTHLHWVVSCGLAARVGR
jgi:hypothetical protein